jgi:hypothetical protein
MIYVEHARIRAKCFKALQNYERILDERNRLFERTQPKGINAEKDRVNGGESVNAFDSYLIAKEKARIDEREKEAQAASNSAFVLLRQIEKQLKESNDIYDQIYRLYRIEKLNPAQIAARVPYSKTSVWRKIKEINKTIKGELENV